jgi:2-polyprenyl-3-methyl-5-hydroxy-6-metoxy-1,4-benzoquinol methylase
MAKAGNEIQNSVFSELCGLDVCSEGDLEPFFNRTRDREDISVFRCSRTGAIFLSQTDHISVKDYEKRDDLNYWNAVSRKEALLSTYDDDTRRAEQFRRDITGKRWADIGTGVGGILDLLSPIALEATGVEPQMKPRNEAIENGLKVVADIKHLRDDWYDVITMFHVFEHVSNPSMFLSGLANKLKDGGKVIIEVPHAKDFLLSFLDLDSFKAFTLWSEHLVLHTRETLFALIRNAGFGNVSIYGYQRYPLANHLYWLRHGKPGGHIKWSELRTNTIDSSYGAMLAGLDMTDSLIAIASHDEIKIA